MDQHELNQKEQSGHWTVRECAAYLGVSPWWVYQNASPRGDVPAVRVGRMLRFSPQAVAAWLAHGLQARG
jgi:excisionase family DNA binding protein